MRIAGRLHLPPSLRPGDVHVWPVWLARTSESAHAGTACAKRVLANYAGQDDLEITVERPNAKPRLRSSRVDLRFNASRAGRLVLVAVSLAREVGVDVEQLGSRRWLSLPGNVLTPDELLALGGVVEKSRDAAFLQLWARKEAVLKAAGVGLAVDPQQVEVSGPTQPPRILRLPASIGPASRWELADLGLPGFAAAIAVERPSTTVSVLGPGRRRLSKLSPLHDEPRTTPR